MSDATSFTSLPVVHNEAQQQFEIHAGSQLCLLTYRRVSGKMVIDHTEVPAELERRGLAARMTEAALEFARSQNLLVEPRCSYAAAFLAKHPEYNHLLAVR